MLRWVYFAWIGIFHLWSIMNDMKVCTLSTGSKTYRALIHV